MAKSTKQKQQLIENYKTQINEAQGIYFFSGSMNAAQTQDMKKKVSNGSKTSLLKNTLFNIASKEAGLDMKADGYNNVVFVNDGLIENAASLSKFLSENEFTSNTVIIGKTSYDGKKLKEIAGLGSTNQVYGKLVGIMSAPTTMVVRCLQNPMQKLVYVLSQVKPS